jgi:uncharacterized protein with FMN-binding domain
MGDAEKSMRRRLFPYILSGIAACSAVWGTPDRAWARDDAQAVSAERETVTLPSRAAVSFGMFHAMAMRRSVRAFKKDTVPPDKVSWFLWAATASWSGGALPGEILLVQQDKAFRYDGVLHALTRETDSLWIWRGMAGQAIYLGAGPLGLGTVTRGGEAFSIGFPDDNVSWQASETITPFPPDRVPDFPLDLVLSESGSAPARAASLQPWFRIFAWVMYGVSPIADSNSRRHRTVPSARNTYPMGLYLVSDTAVYRYVSDKDSFETVVLGDVRTAVDQTWILGDGGGFLITWNPAKMGNRGCALYEAGAMVANARWLANGLGFSTRWRQVSDTAAVKKAIPGLSGYPVLLFGLENSGPEPKRRLHGLRDGRFLAESSGWTGMSVEVLIRMGTLDEVRVLRAKGSSKFFTKVLAAMPQQMIAAGSPEVDGVTGATLSSTSLKEAVRLAVEKSRAAY